MERDAEGFYAPKTADGIRLRVQSASAVLIQFVAAAKPEEKEKEVKKPEVAEATRSGAHIEYFLVLSFEPIVNIETSDLISSTFEVTVCDLLIMCNMLAI